MSRRCLLDSNIVFAFFANRKEVVDRVEALPEIFVPAMRSVREWPGAGFGVRVGTGGFSRPRTPWQDDRAGRDPL